jgi:membrane protease YdiL (CAAX protease family)
LKESTIPPIKSPMNEYLDAVFQGRNEWWRYLLSVAIILILWLIIGSIPIFLFGVYLLMDGNPDSGLTAQGFTGVAPLMGMFVILSSYLFFFMAIFISVHFIHKRPFRSLITSQPKINWSRLFVGFTFWLIIAGLVSIFEAILYPGRYVFSFDPDRFIIYAIFALLLIPIQASCEELFFRGYLMQGLGLRVRGMIILPVVSGLIFGLLHLANPEMAVPSGAWMLAVSYFLVGVFAALVTLLDGGLELALGLHSANNLYTALVANTTVSALASESIFKVNEIDPLYGLISLAIGLVIFYLLAFLIFPREDNTPAKEFSMQDD